MISDYTSFVVALIPLRQLIPLHCYRPKVITDQYYSSTPLILICQGRFSISYCLSKAK
jgi:hypothetical protein